MEVEEYNEYSKFHIKKNLFRKWTKDIDILPKRTNEEQRSMCKGFFILLTIKHKSKATVCCHHTHSVMAKIKKRKKTVTKANAGKDARKLDELYVAAGIS